MVKNRAGKGVVCTLIQKQDKLDDYQRSIVDRNKAIKDYLYSPPDSQGSMDVVLFHEGDITLEHQRFIQEQTPHLPLMFINISSVFALYEEVDLPFCPKSIIGRHTSPGYHSMCRFWFWDFHNFTKQYDWLFRIDDDCLLLEDIRPVMATLNASIHAAATKWISLQSVRFDRIAGRHVNKNQGHVVHGLREFTVKFAQEHHLYDDIYTWSAPYTNLFYLDLNWYRSQRVLQEFGSRVIATRCIYSNRWGDLPLWGANIHLVKEPHHVLPLAYRHGSHRVIVNGSDHGAFHVPS